jgi:hypothetical protein
MNFLRKLSFALASAILILAVVLAQDEDGPVLLNLNPVADGEKAQAPKETKVVIIRI